VPFIATEVIGMTSENEKSDLHSHHEELVGGLYNQMKSIFESSEQPMYLYLDDTHKTCNQKLASLLGYKTPNEWASVEEFSDLVEEKSMKSLAAAYNEAMTRMVGSTINVEWRKKSGDKVDTSVILVPITYSEHLFALHFVSPKA
jgi:carbohydrate-binding DOMON domain-containing protein